MFKGMDHFSFETFLHYMASDKPIVWDFHFNKQFRKNEQYDEIIRIESMDEVLPVLNKKYGLDLKWKFSSYHHIVKEFREKRGYQGANDFSKVAFDKVGSYKEFYNETNRQLVETIYADDFLHYGYTYDDFMNENT